MEDIYRKYPQLRPTAQQSSADALRGAADTVEHQEMLDSWNRFRTERIQKLSACRASIMGQFK